MAIAYQCPFLKSYDQQTKKINCECVQLYFADKDKRLRFVKAYCANDEGYKDCCIAKGLFSDYEEGEE